MTYWELCAAIFVFSAASIALLGAVAFVETDEPFFSLVSFAVFVFLLAWGLNLSGV